MKKIFLLFAILITINYSYAVSIYDIEAWQANVKSNIYNGETNIASNNLELAETYFKDAISIIEKMEDILTALIYIALIMV